MLIATRRPVKCTALQKLLIGGLSKDFRKFCVSVHPVHICHIYSGTTYYYRIFERLRLGCILLDSRFKVQASSSPWYFPLSQAIGFTAELP
jgi:hypothetical protein